MGFIGLHFPVRGLLFYSDCKVYALIYSIHNGDDAPQNSLLLFSFFLTTIFTNGLRTFKLLDGVSRLVPSSLFHCRTIWRGGYVFAEPALEDVFPLALHNP
jgi:hypothetical protein